MPVIKERSMPKFVCYRNEHAMNLDHVAAFKKEFLLKNNSFLIILYFQGGNISLPFTSAEERDKAFSVMTQHVEAKNL